MRLETASAPGTELNVSELLLARGDSGAPALLCHDSIISYGQLRAEVDVLSESLRDQGLHAGERIGIVSENSPFFVYAYLAILKNGLVAVPLPPELKQETFEQIVMDTSLRSVFVSRRFAGLICQWVEAVGAQHILESCCAVGEAQGARTLSGIGNLQTGNRDGSRQIAPTSNRPLRDEVSNSSLACLLFTSGSTGKPKGVMITHRNIVSNTNDIVGYLGLTQEDRCMVVLPFHYCFGLSLLHTHLSVGGSLVLNNNFRLYPEMVLQEMQNKECTGIAGVPSTYQLLLRKSRFREMQLPKLRWFQQAGGRLPNACIEEVRAAFPKVNYYLMYGQTEATARLSYLPPERLTDKLGSIGTGLPSTRLEVLKSGGLPVTPGSDEIGEIVASGDNIALGYWNDPDETGKFFRDGKLYTGDLARVDADGFIFIVERARDMIKSGGNRVSAKEVEDVIAEIPDIIEVAVVGVPHDLLGESIRACAVLHPRSNLDEAGILEYCHKRLPSYKIPGDVILLASLPHNTAGKVLKQALRNEYANGGSVGAAGPCAAELPAAGNGALRPTPSNTNQPKAGL